MDEERHPDLFWALRGGGGADAVEKIVAFRLAVTTTEAKVKLTQNRVPEDIAGVADAYEKGGQVALAQAMRPPRDG